MEESENEKQAKDNARHDYLADGMKEKYPTYKNWKFELVYPGYFAYYNGKIYCFFTPDFNVKHGMDQQFQDAYGVVIDDERLAQFAGVGYADPLTPEQMFNAAKPMMDAVDNILRDDPTFGAVRLPAEVKERVVKEMQALHKAVSDLNETYEKYPFLNDVQPPLMQSSIAASLDEWECRLSECVEQWQKINPD